MTCEHAAAPRKPGAARPPWRPARLYPSPRTVEETLDLVDLTDDAGTRVGLLSGGQRRRVDVAIGIIGRPEVLFLDEPATGLNPEARRRAWMAVEILTTTGTTVLLTTHYIDEAGHRASRLILLAGGRVLADTTPQGLRSQAGPPTIRYQFPDGLDTGDLPPSLAPYLGPASRTLIAPAASPASPLRDLLGWASSHILDLSGIQLGQPGLEDASLAAIGEPATPIEAPRQDAGLPAHDLPPDPGRQ